MNQFADQPYLVDHLSRVLSFRDSATALFMELPKDHTQYILDFSTVAYLSRSFADQLLNEIHELETLGKTVHITNLSPDLADFLTEVKRLKARNRKGIADIELRKVQSWDALEKALLI